MVAHCSLTMSVVEDKDSPPFQIQEAKAARMITDPEWLCAVLQSIHPSCARIKVSFKPQRDRGGEKGGERSVPGEFRVEGETDLGKVAAVLRSDASTMLGFYCDWAGTGPHTYSFQAFANLVRALAASSRVSLSIDRLGYLSVHSIVPLSMTVWEEAQQATTKRMPSIIYTVRLARLSSSSDILRLCWLARPDRTGVNCGMD